MYCVYFSRYPKEAINLQKNYKKQLQQGIIPDKNLLYIISDDFYKELSSIAKTNVNVKKIVEKITYTDGFYIYANR